MAEDSAMHLESLPKVSDSEVFVKTNNCCHVFGSGYVRRFRCCGLRLKPAL